MIKKNFEKISRVSVIIPTYNEESNIEKTLIAVKTQRCSVPIEIIVVDGKSEDNTVNIAKKYVNVLIAPERGKALQLNYAALNSIGDLLIFIDADTLILPNYIDKMVKIFNKEKKLLACSARFKYTNGIIKEFNIGSKKFSLTPQFFMNWAIYLYYKAKDILNYPELAGCNICVRRDVFFNVGGFKQPPRGWGVDKVFSDSLLYYIRKIKFGKIRIISSFHVYTSGRRVSINRGIKKIKQYKSNWNLYTKLAKINKIKY